jgi:hypothetical protein
MIYPYFKIALAYKLLRPFSEPPESEADFIDTEKWKMDLDSN